MDAIAGHWLQWTGREGWVCPLSVVDDFDQLEEEEEEEGEDIVSFALALALALALPSSTGRSSLTAAGYLADGCFILIFI